MIIVMKTGAGREQVKAVVRHIEAMGFKAHVIHGEDRDVIGAIGHEKKKMDLMVLKTHEGVESVIPISKPYKLAGRELKPKASVVKISPEVAVGGGSFVVMAGPCSVESEEQILKTARAVKKSGAQVLRGGAYKPRTSPYDFQGLAEKGLKLLETAREVTGLPLITEVLSQRDVERVERSADVLQVGARNVQNFALLKELGQLKKPVLLKRGMSTTIKEWLMSAEYILSEGNHDVILCERGIRTFETATRNTLDLSAVPVLREQTHLPVIVDPSHGTGVRDYVPPMAMAGAAVGADGLMIEVHPTPEQALSDGAQSLTLEMFSEMMEKLKPLVELMGKHL
ncbi:MAG TPA: 3-deoxy-7-phosphoheptulonate synthase [Deltaproteobacteria bacterium]|nr:3-deoxy-7-phosphoheptulonate synthase [Deltaproteobacteria bacterium]